MRTDPETIRTPALVLRSQLWSADGIVSSGDPLKAVPHSDGNLLTASFMENTALRTDMNCMTHCIISKGRGKAGHVGDMSVVANATSVVKSWRSR